MNNSKRLTRSRRLLRYTHLLLVALTFAGGIEQVTAQPSVTSLTVGDTVPDILMGRMVRYKTPTVRFGDFRGKMLILDFWATWCMPCVAFMPKAQLLQKEFEDRLRIIPVNSYGSKTEETAEDIKKFFSKRKDLTFPSIVEDTLLRKLFPFLGIPHEVWIDRNGVVIAVTGHEDVTEANIRAALEGREMDLVSKDKDKTDAPGLLARKTGSAPLPVGSGAQNNFISRSILTHYKEGASAIGVQAGGIDRSTFPGKIRLYARNLPARQLYLMACSNELRKTYFPYKSILPELQDPAPFSDFTDQRNLYCYELILPLADSNKLHSLMQADLDRYLHFTSAMENRKVECLLLVRIPGKDKLKTKGVYLDPEVQRLQAFEQNTFILSNQPVADLLRTLNSYIGKMYVVDDTHYTGNVDMEIPAGSLSGWELSPDGGLKEDCPMAKGLARYGLRLVKGERQMDYLVVRPVVAEGPSSANNKAFELKGHIAGLTSPEIMLQYEAAGEMITDTAKVMNGAFTFTGKLDGPVFSELWTADQSFAQDQIIENAKMTMVKNDPAAELVFSGATRKEDNRTFASSLWPIQQQITARQKSIMTLMRKDSVTGLPRPDEALSKPIWAEIAALTEKLRSELEVFIRLHPGSGVSLYYLQRISGRVTTAELQSLYNNLDTGLRESTPGKQMSADIGLRRKTDIGATAMNFSQKNEKGEDISLASFRGKYVLLEFWASWCHPCRAENPNVTRAYAKYGHKGFTVLSVSLDSDAEKWKDAITKDQLPWTQLSDLKGSDNAVAVQYGIVGIPFNFLLDPNGVIIAKNLRGGKLDEKLAEVLGQ